MSENDINVKVTTLITGVPTPTKPKYLVCVEHRTNNKLVDYFLSMDKPISTNGFIEVKGFFVSCEQQTEDYISKNYLSILDSTPKDLYMEIMFPWHRVKSIKSLAFKAK
jgi:hypothetical protein